MSEEAVNDRPVELGKRPSDYRVRSVIGAPLVGADGSAVGVLLLDTEDRARRFAVEELHLLTAFAAQGSIAFENARRYAEALRYRPAGRLSGSDRPAATRGVGVPEPPAPPTPMDRWRKAADRLREVRREQAARWGRSDPTAIGRYLTGELAPEQRKQVEADLKAHPELMEVVGLVREASRRRNGAP
jgi:hypothetical protein